MNFKFQISNFKFSIKILLLFFVLCCLFFASSPIASADAVTDKALQFLRSKQDAQGRITTGFSAPSQWSAVAFAVNNIDVAGVKEVDKSLYEYLLTDIPASGSAATEWESRLLAIIAIGKNPVDFGGKNFVSNLEGTYTNGQIGDECSVNDDVFGLLALIASGTVSDAQKKQDVLDFIISKQDPTDGGFGFSAPGCAWYMTSADMTGAALQALVEAKNHGLTNAELDNAIDKAKAYLFSNQNTDGGFGYFGSSDPDTTGWVLQALNVLGMKDSEEETKARNYLLTQQSTADGGFVAYDWGTGMLVSNATTTAQAVIALSGKGWIVKIFDPSASSGQVPSGNSGQVPTAIPTPTPTPTPTSTVAPTATPTPLRPAPRDFEEQVPTPTNIIQDSPLPTPAPEQEVLGEKIESKNNLFFSWFFAGLGLVFVFIYLVKAGIMKKLKN